MIHEGAFRDCNSVLFEGVYDGLLSFPDLGELHTLSFDWYTFHGSIKEERPREDTEETLEAKLASVSDSKLASISNSKLTVKSCLLSILSLPDLPSLKKFKAYGHNFELFRVIEITGIPALMNDN